MLVIVELMRDQMEKTTKCNGEMEVYSRVVGYYRPVKSWNKGKQEEYEMRKSFKINEESEEVEEESDTVVE